MKKIALLHYAYFPHIGGVEILLQEHANILSKLGYSVLVLTGSGEEKNPNIQLREIVEFQSVLNFNPQLQEKILEKQVIDDEFYQLVDVISDRLEENLKDRDIVIVHNMMTVFRNLPFIYAFKRYVKKHTEKKYFVWVHDHMYTRCGGAKVDQNTRSEFEKNLLNQSLSDVTYIAISNTLKKLLQDMMELPEEKIIVIPDGVNIKSFLEIDDSIWNFADDHNLLKSFPVILSPVNILPRKNIEYAVKIISYLKKDYPDLLYIISGQTSRHRKTVDYLQSLKKLISKLNLEKQIVFLGYEMNRSLKDFEIHDLYDLSDLVLYLSEAENFGIPVVESCLSKTPIFVSNLEVFHELGGSNLIYVDYRKESPKAVAKKIKGYLEDNSVIKMNRYMREKYNLETIIMDKLVPLFNIE